MEQRFCPNCRRSWYSAAFEKDKQYECQTCGGILTEDIVEVPTEKEYPYGQNPKGVCTNCGKVFWGWALIRKPGEDICVCREKLIIFKNEGSLDPSSVV